MAYEVLTWEGRDGETAETGYERRDAALARFRAEIDRAIELEDASVVLRERKGRSVRPMARFEVGAL